MILVSDKTQQKTYYFPKEKNGGKAAFLKLFSHLSKNEYLFNVSGSAVLDLYYALSPDFSGCYDGEYDYSILDNENNILQNGLLRIGEYDAGDIIYDFKEEYIIYNPETGESEIIEYGDCTDAVNEAYNSGYTKGYADGYEEGSESGTGGYESGYTSGYTDGFNSGYTKGTTDGYSSGYTDGYEKGQEECESCGWINVETPFNIPASATQINYRITGNMPFDMTAYVMNWQNGDWTLYAPTIHSETSPYDGALQIPENESSGVMEYMIAAGLDDECATHYEAYVIQAPSSDTPVPPTPPTPSGYTSTRFSVEMFEDGDISWEGRGSEYYDIIRDGVRDEGYQLYHSIDNLKAGDIVEFYLMTDNTNPINTPITSTAKHNVYGNIMSLIYVDFESATTIQPAFSNLFQGLFLNDTGLIDAENLILPTKVDRASGCFMSMFYGCTGLTKAPEIKIETLTQSLCQGMFRNCSNLNYIKCYATDISARNCTYNWTDGVSATGDFWKMSGTSWSSGMNGIPIGWSSHNIDE